MKSQKTDHNRRQYKQIVDMLLDGSIQHVQRRRGMGFNELSCGGIRHRGASGSATCAGPGEALAAGLDLDLVVSIDVIHRITDRAVLDAAYRALKPSGE